MLALFYVITPREICRQYSTYQLIQLIIRINTYHYHTLLNFFLVSLHILLMLLCTYNITYF